MLNKKEKDFIKSTVPILKEQGLALTRYFYNRMLSQNNDLKEVFNIKNQINNSQAQALAKAILAYAENIDFPDRLQPVIELICQKHTSLNVQPSDYLIVRENLLFSISEVLSVSINSELIHAWEKAYNQLADVFIQTEKNIYSKQEDKYGGWLGWRDFFILDKVNETDEVISFYLAPKDKRPLPDYQSGQYISLRLFMPELGLKQSRQYSLSATSNRKYFRISVKKQSKLSTESHGHISAILHNSIKIGDIVEISPPTGNFVLTNPEKTNVLISAGVGITPVISMLNQIVEKNINKKDNYHSELKHDCESCLNPTIHFIHVSKNSNTHIFKDELAVLKKQYESIRTHIVYKSPILSDVLGVTYDAPDLISLEKLDLPQDADYYLCGPIEFIDTQNKKLLDLGILQESIKSELFTTSI